MSPIKCPHCQETMSPTDASGIRTHTCLYCNGIWISRNEIGLLLKQEQSSLNIQKLIREAKASSVATRICAACPAQLMKPVITNEVEIDACERCGSLFLDENEIQKVLPKTHEQLTTKGDVVKYAASEGLFWIVLGFFLG